MKPDRLSGLTVLEIELSEINDQVRLPYFIHSVKEVTHDNRYSNPKLALKNSTIEKGVNFYEGC